MAMSDEEALVEAIATRVAQRLGGAMAAAAPARLAQVDAGPDGPCTWNGEPDACNGCGVCCAVETCPAGRLLFRTRGACPALVWSTAERRYLCGLVAESAAHLPLAAFLAKGMEPRLAAGAAAVAHGLAATLVGDGLRFDRRTRGNRIGESEVAVEGVERGAVRGDGRKTHAPCMSCHG